MKQIILLGLIGLPSIHSADESIKLVSVVSLENERKIPLIQLLAEARQIQSKKEKTIHDSFFLSQLKLYRQPNDANLKSPFIHFTVDSLTETEIEEFLKGNFYHLKVPSKNYMFFGAGPLEDAVNRHFASLILKIRNLTMPLLALNQQWQAYIPNHHDKIPLIYHLYGFLKKKTEKTFSHNASHTVVKFSFFTSNDEGSIFQKMENLPIELMLTQPFLLIPNIIYQAPPSVTTQINLDLYYSSSQEAHKNSVAQIKNNVFAHFKKQISNAKS
jgi:hypothetical protein